MAKNFIYTLLISGIILSPVYAMNEEEEAGGSSVSIAASSSQQPPAAASSSIDEPVAPISPRSMQEAMERRDILNLKAERLFTLLTGVSIPKPDLFSQLTQVREAMSERGLAISGGQHLFLQDDKWFNAAGTIMLPATTKNTYGVSGWPFKPTVFENGEETYLVSYTFILGTHPIAHSYGDASIIDFEGIWRGRDHLFNVTKDGIVAFQYTATKPPEESGEQLYRLIANEQQPKNNVTAFPYSNTSQASPIQQSAASSSISEPFAPITSEPFAPIPYDDY